ncbi:aspartyl-phosphate phosphatase Spo0E family protein [Ornithinibacillus salinisoli]|uniref:Aspartyl-phosphate phosphatase Spo0E family protein n=1 Tax=Ornithinibacillus salinisoli TaxID=1848459 RepID=A0ABW4VXT8_9BACI
MEKVLLKKIEKCRREMITLSFSKGLTSEAVVQTSKRLDALLNEYQRKEG